MKRSATPVCVDCGGPKVEGAHRLRQRCKPCGQNFEGYMLTAQRLVHGAVRRGDLAHPASQECTDCGGSATDWDHRDYSKPLEVQAVCRRCNFKRGPALYPRLPANSTVTAEAA